MARIYLSPSTQEHNAYVGGSNEEAQMRDVVTLAAAFLRGAGHTVKVGGTVSAKANALEANGWGCDWYLAVHSDAGGGDGTTAFHHSTSRKGKLLAQAVYDSVRVVSPGSDNGVRVRDDLIETRVPNAPAALVEVAFHDNRIEAAHIKAHPSDYARAIAAGIVKVAGGSILPRYRCIVPHACRYFPLPIPRRSDCSFKVGQQYPYAIGRSGSWMKLWVYTKSGKRVQAWGWAPHFEEV